jgi:thiamine-phosphate pyrophosphorylase
MMRLPRLYAILDRSRFADAGRMIEAAQELMTAGVLLLQYREKSGAPLSIVSEAQQLRDALGRKRISTPLPRGTESLRLIMNDRADLCVAAEFDGVHVGQDDLLPESARKMIGRERWLGISTHNPEQVAAGNETSADYLAIGPVFRTSSKTHPDPVIGLEGIRRARELTRKPLVAIGGITRQNCRSVIDAGADSVAVISDLVPQPGKSAEEFLRILG